jgi:hypothetical protein
MKVVVYYELNQDMDTSEIAKTAEALIKKGLYPAKGVKQTAFYITTDNWGIVINDVENEEAAITNANMWRIAKPGIFNVYKAAIGMESKDAIPIALALGKRIKGEK